MVNFTDIAVFILATTEKNGKYHQDYPTYLESRIVPIRETWGQYFPVMNFVFGTNKKDYDFLSEQCREVIHASEPASINRRLKAKSEQRQSENRVIQFKCPIYEMESHYGLSTRTDTSNASFTNPMKTQYMTSTLLYEFDALFVANCTGEYFGIGPTCRCQESMRFFNQDASMQKAEWFIFMDDDIHFRPHALQTMLTGLSDGTNTNITHTDQGLALVGTNNYRTFEFSKKDPPHSCLKNITAFSFPFAQPAIINRYFFGNALLVFILYEPYISVVFFIVLSFVEWQCST